MKIEHNKIVTLVLTLIFGHYLSAQTTKSGPVINGYGNVYEINDQDFKIDTTQTFKAVFDIMNSPEDLNKVNASIETAARFLNMHAQNGIALAQLKIALVVHNSASKDIINNQSYNEKYGVDNPNEKLVKDLMAVGAQVIFCGQSSASRGFPKEDLIDGVQLSLSAMTALIQLQNQEYRLIKF